MFICSACLMCDPIYGIFVERGVFFCFCFFSILEITFQAEYINVFKFSSSSSDSKYTILIHKVRLAYSVFNFLTKYVLLP